MSDSLQKLMHQYFGFHQFKPGQESIIRNILSSADCLGVMPTGGGKSLCYQLPALALPGITLVISPLIALMKDQVDALNELGIAASYINSSLSNNEVYSRTQAALQGKVKLLYVAPERLESDSFAGLLEQLPVSLLAIDEAHCVSQWGHDFRPSYLHIGSWLKTLAKRPILAAFTATASPQVREDIIQLLGLRNPFVMVNSFDRPNLRFSVRKGVDRTRFISQYLRAHPDESGIIYASTRKEVDQLAEHLRKKGFTVGPYHAGLSSEERTHNQEAFIRDELQVIVATNAFGLGIDKSNVRFVIHNNIPRHLEAYYQEAGRAGRDGQPADCILLFHPADIQIHNFLIEQSQLTDELRRVEYAKLRSMIDYCHTTRCLRSTIMAYFGEERPEEPCDNCSNCGEKELQDITIDAQKIFSCILRMKQPYGTSMIAAVLKGSQNKKVLAAGFDQLSTYGIMSGYSTGHITDLINLLIAEDYLVSSGGKYPVVTLSPQARPVLRSEVTLVLSLPKAPAAATGDDTLFQALRSLRQEIARAQNLPPYMIFSDHTLRELCIHLPLNEEALLEIDGVGQVKLEKYGDAFLALLQKHQNCAAMDHPAAVEQTPSPKSEKKKNTSAEKKTPSHLLTWQEHQEGKSIAEIARERNLSMTTIENHLLQAFKEGHPVNWAPYLSQDEKTQILQAAQIVGRDKLKPIKEALPQSISYFAIKIALLETE